MTDKDVELVSNTLLTLQHQYMDFVEAENPRCQESFQYYQELAEELRKKCQTSFKYAKGLVANAHFLEAFTAVNAPMYIPVLAVLNTALASHLNLCKALLKEVRNDNKARVTKMKIKRIMVVKNEFYCEL